MFLPDHSSNSKVSNVTLDGVVVACLPLYPRFVGSKPPKDDGTFKDNKNACHDFLWRGSKAVGPMS
jgi:hypothetical protein